MLVKISLLFESWTTTFQGRNWAWWLGFPSVPSFSLYSTLPWVEVFSNRVTTKLLGNFIWATVRIKGHRRFIRNGPLTPKGCGGRIMIVFFGTFFSFQQCLNLKRITTFWVVLLLGVQIREKCQFNRHLWAKMPLGEVGFLNNWGELQKRTGGFGGRKKAVTSMDAGKPGCFLSWIFSRVKCCNEQNALKRTLDTFNHLSLDQNHLPERNDDWNDEWKLLRSKSLEVRYTNFHGLNHLLKDSILRCFKL